MAFLYPWKGSSVAIRTPARKSSPRSASQFLYTVPDLPGTRSTQACRGVILPSCQVYDAGELTGPRRRRSGVFNCLCIRLLV